MHASMPTHVAEHTKAPSTAFHRANKGYRDTDKISSIGLDRFTHASPPYGSSGESALAIQ